jgi:hypothetical protein
MSSFDSAATTHVQHRRRARANAQNPQKTTKDEDTTRAEQVIVFAICGQFVARASALSFCRLPLVPFDFGAIGNFQCFLCFVSSMCCSGGRCVNHLQFDKQIIQHPLSLFYFVFLVTIAYESVLVQFCTLGRRMFGERKK